MGGVFRVPHVSILRPGVDALVVVCSSLTTNNSQLKTVFRVKTLDSSNFRKYVLYAI